MSTSQLVRHDSINMIAQIMQIDNLQASLTDYECGDMKFTFSSYGRKITPDLPYLFTGRNGNSVGLNLLSRLDDMNGPLDVPQIPKICLDSNYVSSVDVIDVQVGNPSGVEYDVLNCIEIGPPVKAIRVNCRNFANPLFYTESGSNAFIRYFQFIFNNDNGTFFAGPEFEDPVRSDDDEIVEINVDEAATITFIRETNGAGLGNRAWELITKDKNGNVIDGFGCGETIDGTRLTEAEALADPGNHFRQEIPVIDFLGFSNIEETNNGSSFITFQLTRYVAP